MNRSDFLAASWCLMVTVLCAAPGLCEGGPAPFGEHPNPQAGGPKRTAINISSTEIPLALTSVANLSSDNWIDDMEFELENRSDRPIYYVLLVIKVPDIPKITAPDGILRGLVTTARYGRDDFSINQRELAREDDVPIKPGGKVVFKLDAQHREGLRHYLRSHDLPESRIQRIYIRIDELSFGDGSGYTLGSEPFPRRCAAPCTGLSGKPFKSIDATSVRLHSGPILTAWPMTGSPDPRSIS